MQNENTKTTSKRCVHSLRLQLFDRRTMHLWKYSVRNFCDFLYHRQVFTCRQTETGTASTWKLMSEDSLYFLSVFISVFVLRQDGDFRFFGVGHRVRSAGAFARRCLLATISPRCNSRGNELVVSVLLIVAFYVHTLPNETQFTQFCIQLRTANDVWREVSKK